MGGGGGWSDGGKEMFPWEREGKGKVSGGDGRDDGRAATNACTVVFLGGRRTANDATPRSSENSRENQRKTKDRSTVDIKRFRRVAGLSLSNKQIGQVPLFSRDLTWWRDARKHGGAT